MRLLKYIIKEYKEHYYKLIRLEKIAIKEFFFMTPLLLIQLMLFGIFIAIILKIA